MILLPSKNKYLVFKNLKNTIQHNFIAFADIESYIKYKNINIHELKHLMSGYYLHCLDEKYSKKVQLFDKLEDFKDNLIEEFDYVENINDKILNYKTDMSTFDQKEYDKVNKCKYCNHNFEKNHNGRQITLTEKVNKYKLKRILDDLQNNNINDETQNNLKQYYKNLNDNGEINILHKQNNNTGRYYSNKFSLQNMFNEVRNSIIHKDSIDIDFKNSIATIIIYLADKHNLKIPNIKLYSKDRENILKNINKDRMTGKKVIISILNGGYHDDKNINKFLKNIEKESILLREYFYKIVKELMMKKFIIIKQNLFQELFKIMKIKIMSLIFDGILLLPDQSIKIQDIENYLYNKTNKFP